MSSISHLNTDCQEEIPFYTQVWDGRTNEPTTTPLADLMAASSDPAGMDAEVMPYEAWLEVWEFEPEPAYFEDEV